MRFSIRHLGGKSKMAAWSLLQFTLMLAIIFILQAQDAAAKDKKLDTSPSSTNESAETFYQRQQELHSSNVVPPATASDVAIAKRQQVAFVNVNVVTMTSDSVLRDQVVLVDTGRIIALGKASDVAVPDGARVIDGGNGFLMPGLADMHVHSNGDPLSLSLFLANGVTTVREMSGEPAYLTWARQVDSGSIIGPRIYTTGPLLGEKNVKNGRVSIETAQDARREVESEYAKGYRMIKPYTYLPAEAYRAAVQTAKAKGMYVVGHIPYSVGTAGVIAAGQDEVAHVHSFHPDFFLDFDPARTYGVYRIDGDFIKRVVPRLKSAEVSVTTTLIVIQSMADSANLDRYLARAEQRYDTPGAEAYMRSSAWGFNSLWPHSYLIKTYLPYLRRLTVALHDAGVRLVLGTDSGATAGLIHGFSAHAELELLVKAGLSPFDALLTGTRNAAAVAGEENTWGVVATGMRADLLLLGSNPLRRIASTRDIVGVMRDGRWIDRAHLDLLLKRVCDAYHQGDPESGICGQVASQ